MFVASDVAATLNHSNKVVYLHDSEVATLTLNSHSIKHLDGREIEKKVLDDSAFILVYQYGSRLILKDYVKDFVVSAAENYDLAPVYLEK